MIAISIDLYNSTADERIADKSAFMTKLNESTINCNMKHNTTTLTPSFVAAYNAAYLTCNYVVSSTLGKSYYVKDITITSSGQMIISCYVDVRATFANGIKNSTGVVLRAESIGKPTKYPDSKLPIYPNNKQILTITMPETSGTFTTNPTSPNDYVYLLTCIGGSASI